MRKIQNLKIEKNKTKLGLKIILGSVSVFLLLVVLAVGLIVHKLPSVQQLNDLIDSSGL